jgi:glycosyltransferase involved in cell wall biosynthesis
MKAAILYYDLLGEDGQQQRIGGVETYLLNLAMVGRDLGWNVSIFQYGATEFSMARDDCVVKGVPVKGLSHEKKKERLFAVASRHVDPAENVLIFGADHISIPTRAPRTIAIQHGIAWDLPAQHLTAHPLCKFSWGRRLKKIKARRDALRRFDNCRNRVCVDYNFFNWYRTMIPREPVGNVWVIPNCAPVLSAEEVTERANGTTVRVLFARRFVAFRGTRLFAGVVQRLLEQYPQVEFTFAGEGPDEGWLRETFARQRRVTIMKYLPQAAKEVYVRHHIAVIPSLASEGTSLSVAEAMGAGCAVVATCVGGITNMIIDGHNGLLVMPEANSLHAALRRLLEDPTLRRDLGAAAQRCAAVSFSLATWRQRWRTVLQQVAEM